MILNSIIIENIRSYQHEEVEFPRGITLFEGDIGSGKSTVLMAIEFALFGLGSQKADALLAKKSDMGHVILDFSTDGERYEIKRILLRKGSTVSQDSKNSWIKIGGQKELLSPSELKQRVLQILKFNEPADPKAESRIFRYAIFTPQEAMKDVLFNPKRRLETIRKAFGIEDYSIVESNAREVLYEIKVKAGILEGKFSNISELESGISESQKIKSKLKSEISQKQELQKTLQADENKKMQELKELQAKNSEKIKLESKKENTSEKIATNKARIERIKQKFADYKNELKEDNHKLEKLAKIKKPETKKSIPDIVAEIKRFQKINDEIIRSESEKDSIHQDIVRLKERFGKKIDSEKETLESTLNGLCQEKEELEKIASEIKEGLEKVNSQKIQSEALKKSLEEEIAEFSKLGNACPTCKQTITDEHHHSLVDDKERKVRSLTDELISTANSFFASNKEFKEIQSKIESYTEKISQIQIIIPRIEEFEAKSARENQLDREIKELERKLQDPEFEDKNPVTYLNELKDRVMQFESLTDQIKQIVKTKQKIEKTVTEHREEADLLASQISEMDLELEQIQAKLGSFADSDEDTSSKERELDSLRKEMAKVSGMIAASLENLKNQTEKIRQGESKITESRRYEARHRKFTEFQRWLETFFIPTVSQIEKQVLLSILQDFNETYTRWYSILIEDSTKESQIDEDFTPIVRQDEYDQDVGYLSGGEKTSIALAYRLTLNSLMRKETESIKSNLLILDEPTDGFSKNQLGKIRELLDELKSEQIVLVSHERELETYVDNIFQISKETGVSKISKMNQR